MTKKSPYAIIKNRRMTEKSRMLENLQNASSNPSLSRCKTPKYVFDVDPLANKYEIASAIEEIYADKKIKVLQVNTATLKMKQRRVRGHAGMTAGGKKAVVTLQPGQTIDEPV
ncbi:MAG: ribosomal protein [Parachlamydiales bacterium]|nr:ribosomal protein [Parachlamydiales bacterium]